MTRQIAQDAPTASLASLDELLATVTNPWVATRIVEPGDKLRLFVMERYVRKLSGAKNRGLPFLVWVSPVMPAGRCFACPSCGSSAGYPFDLLQAHALFRAAGVKASAEFEWCCCPCQGRFIE